MTWFFIGYLIVMGYSYEAQVIAPDEKSCWRIHKLMQRQIDLGMMHGNLTDCKPGKPPAPPSGIGT